MKLTLIQKKHEAGDAVSFIFKSNGEITWKAGQFLHYTLKHENTDSRKEERYFTISSAPFEKNIVITTRLAGDKGSSFKKTLQSLAIGAEIEADAPDGEFVIENPSGKEYIFIAGGIGITPFRSILLALDNKNSDINATLFYSNRTPDFIFKKELEVFATKHKNFKIHYFVEPERITMDAIKQIAPDIAKPFFYISGPEPMVETFEKMLKNADVPEEHLVRDYFPGYDWP